MEFILMFKNIIAILRCKEKNNGAYEIRNIYGRTEQIGFFVQGFRTSCKDCHSSIYHQPEACICNDLVDELGLAQFTISQHLKELKSIGIIQGTIEGKSVCYCIDEKLWKQMQAEFNGFFDQEVKVTDCCP